jgi:3-deoxy-manno-octulosonate cytidylyltransferase (CMP-KDO synthetase)
MRILGVIPARYGSTRLPAKPLLSIQGKPLIAWVYEAAKQAGVFDTLVVATDHDAIADAARGLGASVMMTRTDHRSGSDRVAEVASHYPDHEVAVNVQGDQPFIEREMLASLLDPYVGGRSPELTTLGCPLDWERGYHDSATVKVLLDRNDYALFFSRAPVPYLRSPGPRESLPVLHHLGLYAFRRDFLMTFTGYQATPLELCESLEQLRALEYGHRMLVCRTSKPTIEVNTPEDLQHAEQLARESQAKPQ